MYTVEVTHDEKQLQGSVWTWMELSCKTVRETPSFDAAYLAYNDAVEHETRYNDGLSDGERVEVLLVEWDFYNIHGNVLDAEVIYPRENSSEGWF